MDCTRCGKRPREIDSYCKACKNQYTLESRAKRKSRELAEGYYVYYLPEEHYCGVTGDLTERIRLHQSSHNGVKHNVEGWRVLYHSFDKAEAYHHEAMFQSILGIKGLNYK